jgi:hypothetical protein
MREISEIHFATGAGTDVRELLEQYVLDAVERLPETGHCEYAAFMPLTHGTHGDVWLTVAGDGDAIVDSESQTWDELVEAGLVSEWDVTDVTGEWYDSAGEQGGELQLRLHRVANRATRAAFEEFDERPAAVEAYPDEASSYPVGWWTLLHVVAGHQAYAPGDTMELFLQGVRETCEDAVEAGSPGEAVRRIDDCIESLETLRADVEG